MAAHKKNNTIKPVGKVKVTRIGPPLESERRVQVCTEGETGPYVLCKPRDYNGVRAFLVRRGYVISVDPTVITDASTREGKSMGSLINLPELKAKDAEALQRELDQEFPTEDTASMLLSVKKTPAKPRKRKKK